MKNHRSLRHSTMHGARPAGGAHRSPPARIAHTRAVRGILVLALTLGALGAVALSWPRPVPAGHTQVTSQQHARGPAHPGGPHLMVTKAKPQPFMY